MQPLPTTDDPNIFVHKRPLEYYREFNSKLRSVTSMRDKAMMIHNEMLCNKDGIPLANTDWTEGKCKWYCQLREHFCTVQKTMTREDL